MPTKKYERNYLANLTTANAQIWFRYRSKICGLVECSADIVTQAVAKHRNTSRNVQDLPKKGER